MKPNFRSYYAGMFYKPGTVFTALADDSNRLRHAYIALSISAILYTLVYVFLIFGGGLPFSPWLNIEPQEYYKWNVFFCAPSMFLGWILAAGVVHLKCRVFTKEGSFEQTLACSAFGISIASWATGIHDVVSSFLGAVHIINQNDYEVQLNSPTVWRTLLWIQMVVYVLLLVFFYAKAIKAVYKLKTWQCIWLSFPGLAMYQGFFFIFNR